MLILVNPATSYYNAHGRELLQNRLSPPPSDVHPLSIHNVLTFDFLLSDEFSMAKLLDPTIFVYIVKPPTAEQIRQLERYYRTEARIYLVFFNNSFELELWKPLILEGFVKLGHMQHMMTLVKRTSSPSIVDTVELAACRQKAGLNGSYVQHDAATLARLIVRSPDTWNEEVGDSLIVNELHSAPPTPILSHLALHAFMGNHVYVIYSEKLNLLERLLVMTKHMVAEKQVGMVNLTPHLVDLNS